jgi:hypothetical protein
MKVSQSKTRFPPALAEDAHPHAAEPFNEEKSREETVTKNDPPD